MTFNVMSKRDSIRKDVVDACSNLPWGDWASGRKTRLFISSMVCDVAGVLCMDDEELDSICFYIEKLEEFLEEAAEGPTLTMTKTLQKQHTRIAELETGIRQLAGELWCSDSGKESEVISKYIRHT